MATLDEIKARPISMDVQRTLARLLSSGTIGRDELTRWLTYAAVGLADDALYAHSRGEDDRAASHSRDAQRAAQLAKLIGGE